MVQCSCFVSEPLLFRSRWRLLQYPPRQALRDCILMYTVYMYTPMQGIHVQLPSYDLYSELSWVCRVSSKRVPRKLQGLCQISTSINQQNLSISQKFSVVNKLFVGFLSCHPKILKPEITLLFDWKPTWFKGFKAFEAFEQKYGHLRILIHWFPLQIHGKKHSFYICKFGIYNLIIFNI